MNPQGPPAGRTRAAGALPPLLDVASVTARLLSELPVQDLNIEDVPIEAVIERAFSEGEPARKE